MFSLETEISLRKNGAFLFATRQLFAQQAKGNENVSNDPIHIDVLELTLFVVLRFHDTRPSDFGHHTTNINKKVNNSRKPQKSVKQLEMLKKRLLLGFRSVKF